MYPEIGEVTEHSRTYLLLLKPSGWNNGQQRIIEKTMTTVGTEVQDQGSQVREVVGDMIQGIGIQGGMGVVIDMVVVGSGTMIVRRAESTVGRIETEWVEDGILGRRILRIRRTSARGMNFPVSC